jgi:hypothetical protein
MTDPIIPEFKGRALAKDLITVVQDWVSQPKLVLSHNVTTDANDSRQHHTAKNDHGEGPDHLAQLKTL